MASKSTATPASRRSSARSQSARPRRSSSASRDDSLIREDEMNQLIDEGKALAEQLIGRPRFAAVSGMAPTLLTIVGRYARREPLKAAGIAVVIGGLYLAARALLQGAPEMAASHAGGNSL